MRALLVSTPKRAADLPDVPTPAEAGLKDAESAIWLGVFMPSKTPRDIVEKFHAAGVKLLAEPAMQDRLKQLGIEPLPMNPAEMDAFVARETADNLRSDQGGGDRAVAQVVQARHCASRVRYSTSFVEEV